MSALAVDDDHYENVPLNRDLYLIPRRQESADLRQLNRQRVIINGDSLLAALIQLEPIQKNWFSNGSCSDPVWPQTLPMTYLVERFFIQLRENAGIPKSNVCVYFVEEFQEIWKSEYPPNSHFSAAYILLCVLHAHLRKLLPEDALTVKSEHSIEGYLRRERPSFVLLCCRPDRIDPSIAFSETWKHALKTHCNHVGILKHFDKVELSLDINNYDCLHIEGQPTRGSRYDFNLPSNCSGDANNLVHLTNQSMTAVVHEFGLHANNICSKTNTSSVTREESRLQSIKYFLEAVVPHGSNPFHVELLVLHLAMLGHIDYRERSFPDSELPKDNDLSVFVRKVMGNAEVGFQNGSLASVLPWLYDLFDFRLFGALHRLLDIDGPDSIEGNPLQRFVGEACKNDCMSLFAGVQGLVNETKPFRYVNAKLNALGQPTQNRHGDFSGRQMEYSLWAGKKQRILHRLAMEFEPRSTDDHTETPTGSLYYKDEVHAHQCKLVKKDKSNVEKSNEGKIIARVEAATGTIPTPDNEGHKSRPSSNSQDTSVIERLEQSLSAFQEKPLHHLNPMKRFEFFREGTRTCDVFDPVTMRYRLDPFASQANEAKTCYLEVIENIVDPALQYVADNGANIQGSDLHKIWRLIVDCLETLAKRGFSRQAPQLLRKVSKCFQDYECNLDNYDAELNSLKQIRDNSQYPDIWPRNENAIDDIARAIEDEDQIPEDAQLSLSDWHLRYMGPRLRRPRNPPDPKGRLDFGRNGPDEWQRSLMDAIDNFSDALVIAPPSSGKTFATFRAVNQVLESDRKSVIVFVTPTFSLCLQLSAQLQKKYDVVETKRRGLVGIWTSHLRNIDRENCRILVSTAEGFNTLLYFTQWQPWLRRIRYVVIDELHNVSGTEHSQAYEQIILSTAAPIIGLSATVGNPDALKTWMRGILTLRSINSGTQNSRSSELTVIKPETIQKPNDISPMVWSPGSSEDTSLVDIHPLGALRPHDLSRFEASEFRQRLSPEHIAGLQGALRPERRSEEPPEMPNRYFMEDCDDPSSAARQDPISAARQDPISVAQQATLPNLKSARQYGEYLVDYLFRRPRSEVFRRLNKNLNNAMERRRAIDRPRSEAQAHYGTENESFRFQVDQIRNDPQRWDDTDFLAFAFLDWMSMCRAPRLFIRYPNVLADESISLLSVCCSMAMALAVEDAIEILPQTIDQDVESSAREFLRAWIRRKSATSEEIPSDSELFETAQEFERALDDSSTAPQPRRAASRDQVGAIVPEGCVGREETLLRGKIMYCLRHGIGPFVNRRFLSEENGSQALQNMTNSLSANSIQIAVGVDGNGEIFRNVERIVDKEDIERYNKAKLQIEKRDYSNSKAFAYRECLRLFEYLRDDNRVPAIFFSLDNSGCSRAAFAMVYELVVREAMDVLRARDKELSKNRTNTWPLGTTDEEEDSETDEEREGRKAKSESNDTFSPEDDAKELRKEAGAVLEWWVRFRECEELQPPFTNCEQTASARKELSNLRNTLWHYVCRFSQRLESFRAVIRTQALTANGQLISAERLDRAYGKDGIKNEEVYERKELFLMQRGVAFYNSKISFKDKEALLHLFCFSSDSNSPPPLQLIIGTDAIGQGLNMPVKTVVEMTNSAFLNGSMYLQQTGRAGRRGIDDRGYVVFLALPSEKICSLLLAKPSDLRGECSTSMWWFLKNFKTHKNIEHFNNDLARPGDPKLRNNDISSIRSSIETNMWVTLFGNLQRVDKTSIYSYSNWCRIRDLLHQLQFYVVCEQLHNEQLINSDMQTLYYSFLPCNLSHVGPVCNLISRLLCTGILQDVVYREKNTNKSKQLMLRILAWLLGNMVAPDDNEAPSSGRFEYNYVLHPAVKAKNGKDIQTPVLPPDQHTTGTSDRCECTNMASDHRRVSHAIPGPILNETAHYVKQVTDTYVKGLMMAATRLEAELNNLRSNKSFVLPESLLPVPGGTGEHFEIAADRFGNVPRMPALREQDDSLNEHPKSRVDRDQTLVFENSDEEEASESEIKNGENWGQAGVPENWDDEEGSDSEVVVPQVPLHGQSAYGPSSYSEASRNIIDAAHNSVRTPTDSLRNREEGHSSNRFTDDTHSQSASDERSETHPLFQHLKSKSNHSKILAPAWTLAGIVYGTADNSLGEGSHSFPSFYALQRAVDLPLAPMCTSTPVVDFKEMLLPFSNFLQGFIDSDQSTHAIAGKYDCETCHVKEGDVYQIRDQLKDNLKRICTQLQFKKYRDCDKQYKLALIVDLLLKELERGKNGQAAEIIDNQGGKVTTFSIDDRRVRTGRIRRRTQKNFVGGAVRIYPPDHQSTGNISHKRIGKESIKDEYKLYWVGRVEGYDRDNYIVYCYNDKSTRKCGKDPALTKNPLRGTNVLLKVDQLKFKDYHHSKGTIKRECTKENVDIEFGSFHIRGWTFKDD